MSHLKLKLGEKSAEALKKIIEETGAAGPDMVITTALAHYEKLREVKNRGGEVILRIPGEAEQELVILAPE